MKYAIIENGVVTNVVVAHEAMGDNWVATEQAGPGWLYENGKFTAPPPVVPTKAEQEAKRQAAYAAEADPIYFQWQAGEATEAEWLAKRQEIRDRFPYPA